MEMENKRPGLRFKRTALRILNKHEVILVAGASDDSSGSEDGAGPDDPGDSRNQFTNLGCPPETTSAGGGCPPGVSTPCTYQCVTMTCPTPTPTPTPTPHPKGG